MSYYTEGLWLKSYTIQEIVSFTQNNSYLLELNSISSGVLRVVKRLSLKYGNNKNIANYFGLGQQVTPQFNKAGFEYPCKANFVFLKENQLMPSHRGKSQQPT